LAGSAGPRVYETNTRLDQTRVDLLEKIDQTNARLDQTNRRLDQTRVDLLEKIDQTRVDLDARLDGTNARLSRLDTSVSTLVGTVSTLVDHTTQRDDRLEAGLHDLRRRVEVVGARTEP
jgi:chromosome segregation ATPase